jgi:hypothetical protein
MLTKTLAPIVVLFAVAACGGDSIAVGPDPSGGGASPPTTANGTGGSLSHGPTTSTQVGPGPSVVAGTGGMMGGTGGSSATVGAGGSGGSAASATTTGTGGPACCSQPVQIAGPVQIVAPVQMLTADTDVSRLVTGTTDATGKIADGPFVLTDISFAGNPSGSVSFAPSGDCTQQSTSLASTAVNVSIDLHGMRLFAPAGAALCGSRGAGNAFSGFRPY